MAGRLPSRRAAGLLVVLFRSFGLHLLLLLAPKLKLRGGVARDPCLIFFCQPRPGPRPFAQGDAGLGAQGIGEQVQALLCELPVQFAWRRLVPLAPVPAELGHGRSAKTVPSVQTGALSEHRPGGAGADWLPAGGQAVWPSRHHNLGQRLTLAARKWNRVSLRPLKSEVA
jgi:hypothetical protein